MPQPIVSPRASAGRRRAMIRRRRARLGLGLGLAAIVVVVVIATVLGGGPRPLPRPPAPGLASAAHAPDPFSFTSSRAADFTSRATAGNAHVLFTKSPGGALATARRVAAFRPLIDRAVRGTGIDPALLEGLVFVESAGRPQVIAGGDPAQASGLTQILAATGQSLLGMKIDLARSRALTRQIDAVAAGTRRGDLAHLEAQRAAADPRFDPAAALAATVRYLRYAERLLGREDLAFESYHMGIGNLQTVLGDYDGGRPVPYVQLYFDVSPTRHAAAFHLLASFGDDSSLYWWRILGAVRIMGLYRTDPAALTRLSALQLADAAGAAVLAPPGRVGRFADPASLARAYQHRSVVPLPRNAAALGLAYDPVMGAGARLVRAPRSLYRGLRPDALALLVQLASRIRSLSGGAQPIHVLSTVSDARYQSAEGVVDPMARTGYSFQIDRRYRNGAQAAAFQALLDRLQSLNLIAWAPEGSEIEVTVASDAASWRG